MDGVVQGLRKVGIPLERLSEDCDVFEKTASQEADGAHYSCPTDSDPNVNDEEEIISMFADYMKISVQK